MSRRRTRRERDDRRPADVRLEEALAAGDLERALAVFASAITDLEFAAARVRNRGTR